MEVLLTVAIVLIMGTFAFAFMARFFLNNAVANTADQIAEQLHKAQVYSMSGKQDTNWGVKYSSGKITLYSTSNPAFDESFSIDSNVTITGFSPVTFVKATGIPSSPLTIIVSGNNSSQTVTLDSQGVVKR